MKTRLAVEHTLRTSAGSGANLGVNPTSDQAAAVTRFLDGLTDAFAAATQRANSTCALDMGSEACRSATELLDRVAAFERAARGAYASSYLFPMEGSPVADSIAAAVGRLDEELRSVGVIGINDPIIFASKWFSADAFAQLPARPEIGKEPLAPSDGSWRLGDLEVGVLARVVQGAMRDSATPTPIFSYHVAAGVTGRLATGEPRSDGRLFDLGSGDGQLDIETRLIALMRWRVGVGLRVGARYGFQQPATLDRRVSPPDYLLAPLSTLHSVNWNPAPYVGLDAEPSWAVTDELSVFGSYRRFQKGRDDYSLVTSDMEDPAGAGEVDVFDLERESASTWQRAGLGLRYSTTDPLGAGTAAPLELHFRLLFPVGGSGGQVPVTTSLEVGLRVFRTLY